MHAPVTSWLSLGGNQGDSRALLSRAVNHIKQLPNTQIHAVSALYETPPWGDESQANFYNALVKVATALAPEALLTALQEIEDSLGRVRDPARPWGPRTIDIDILLFGEVMMDLPRLTLPHPRLTERAFVLMPLVAMEPMVEIPGHGPAAELLAELSPVEIRLVASPGWEGRP